VEDVTVALEDFSTSARMVDQAHEESERPSIEEAPSIVAGGRGLAVRRTSRSSRSSRRRWRRGRATRAVVDAGWYPYSTQVGQTADVSPKLYMRAASPGAIQHKVGMQSSGVIVAINKDSMRRSSSSRISRRR